MGRNGSALLDDYPLLVLPSLACALGLPEAVFVQQIHYWIVNKRRNGQATVVDGREWVYNTQKEWQKQFPFWTTRQLQYVIDGAVKSRAVITMRPEGSNRRTWYTINYDLIDQIENGDVGVQPVQRKSQDTKTYNGTDGVTTPESDCTGFVPIYKNVHSNVQKCILHDKESETTTDKTHLADSRPTDANLPPTPRNASPHEPEVETKPVASKKARKPKEVKPETELFNRVKTAWFKLADEREAQQKRAPHRMITPQDFKQFKLSIEALDQVAKQYEWTLDQTVEYVIEAATLQLDDKWWKDHAMTPYILKHTVNALQGWWIHVKKPALSERRMPAPTPVDPSQPAAYQLSHAERVAYTNAQRKREHEQKLAELAENGQAPLGYVPPKRNPFDRT